MKLSKLKWLGFMLAVTAVPGYSEVTTPPAVVPAAPATTPATPTAPAASTPIPANLPPNLAELMKLANAGVGDGVVIAYIKNSTVPYHLSASDILQLKKEGLSSAVIAAMLSHDTALQGNSRVAPPDYSQKLYAPTNPVQSGEPPAQPVPAPAPNLAQTPPPQPAAPAPAPAPSTVVVQTPQPPPQVEVVTVSPGADYYWEPGYWSWNHGWIWIGGGWHGRGWAHRGWDHRGWDRHHR